MAGKSGAIRCSACGEESLLKRVPSYDGFRKAGETLSCASCGHVYASEEEVPFVGARRPALFDESDAPRKIDLFRDDEKARFCRHCRHYVVNPFTQRCDLRGREVEATGCCESFERRETKDP